MANGSAALTSTTATAFGTVAGGGIIIWIFECIKQGALVVPDANTAMQMSAIIAPICHAIRNRFINRLQSLPDPAQIVNIAAVSPAPPTAS